MTRDVARLDYWRRLVAVREARFYRLLLGGSLDYVALGELEAARDGYLRALRGEA